MRYLSRPQAVAYLRSAAGLEQMLSTDLRAGFFRWLEARASAEGFALVLHETMDDGSDDFLDVYEFRSADADADDGDGTLLGRFSDADSLLEAALEFGAEVDRWVTAGVIQDEYADLRNRS